MSPPLSRGLSTSYTSSPHSTSASDSSSSITIVTIIIASAVIISASIYLLLRLLSKRFRRAFSTTADDVVQNHIHDLNQHPQCQVDLNFLPLFTFHSVTHNFNGGDCAVCLSKFKPHDQLRLLPLCCHAFHTACIDKWIVSNHTCPLCRSTVLPSGSDVLDKILSAEYGSNSNNTFTDGEENGGSFRIELGSVSLRRGGEAIEGTGRSYSLGSFEYIVDDCVYEVPARCTSSDSASKEKELTARIPGEVSGGGNWLREYVDRVASVSSRTMSFGSSRRFCSGNSEATVVPEDLEWERK